MVKRKKIKRKKLSAEEKKRRRREKKFRTDINTVFTNSSFIQIPTRNTHFELDGRKGEIDAVFIYENIIVLSEDTTLKKQDEIKQHLLKTSAFFDHINKNKIGFINLLEKEFLKFKENKSKKYSNEEFKLIFLYCSMNTFDQKYKERYPNILFLDYPYLQYFFSLSRIISKS